MRKILITAFFSLFLVASLGAQERITQRIEFFYENGKAYNDAIGDTLTGASGAEGTDTIYFSALGPDKRAFDLILVAVAKDTDFVASQQKTDTTLVRIFRGVGGFYTDSGDTASVGAAINAGVYIATDILGFVTDDFMFEIDATAGNFSATSYKLVIDHTLMATTDSTAYRMRLIGIYNNE